MGHGFAGLATKALASGVSSSNSNILSSSRVEYATMSKDFSRTTESAIPPAYEVYREARQPISLSSAAKRLKWALEGPLNSAIEVMHEMKYDPNIPTEPHGDQMHRRQSGIQYLNLPSLTLKFPLSSCTSKASKTGRIGGSNFIGFCHYSDENGEDRMSFSSGIF
jgi:hypothetical protein